MVYLEPSPPDLVVVGTRGRSRGSRISARERLEPSCHRGAVPRPGGPNGPETRRESDSSATGPRASPGARRIASPGMSAVPRGREEILRTAPRAGSGGAARRKRAPSIFWSSWGPAGEPGSVRSGSRGPPSFAPFGRAVVRRRPRPGPCRWISFWPSCGRVVRRSGSWNRALLRLAPSGMVGFAWPKKSGGLRTNLNDAVVRRLGLATGLVDVKVGPLDPTWSALKFVRRLADRASGKEGKEGKRSAGRSGDRRVPRTRSVDYGALARRLILPGPQKMGRGAVRGDPD